MAIIDLAKKLTLDGDLSPDGRDINFKGRFRQAFSAVGKNSAKMIIVNIFVMLFALPLLVMFLMILPQQETARIAAEALNFSGGIGIGYGIVDDTLRGIEIIYNTRQEFVLYYLVPGLMLVSVALSGAYQCCRNALWGAKIDILKNFGRGISKNWWKFLITMTYLGGLALSFSYSLLEIMKRTAIYGGANAGFWIWMILSAILIFASVMFIMIALPMMSCYKFKFKDVIKNTSILTIIVAVVAIFVEIGMIAPMILVFAGVFKYIVYIFMLTFGVSIYITMDIAFGQYVCDSFIGALYQNQIMMRKKEQEKASQIKKKTKVKTANRK